MADVFLSYAREDREYATAIASVLGEAGLSVWFDQYIPPASQWESVLSRELERARCILMLWSPYARTSDWVHKEGTVGLHRTNLVPVQIGPAPIPEVFGSIQFADFTSWNKDPTSSLIKELLHAVHSQILPTCQITFDSPLELRAGALEKLWEAYLHVAARQGCMPVPGRFSAPRSEEAKRRLRRAISSLQVSINWDSTLTTWYADPMRRKAFADRVERLEHHLPLIWLRLLEYGGPFFSSISSPRAHESFLRFASLMFLHEMFHDAKASGKPLNIIPPLTAAQLDHARWEHGISVFFQDSIALATVTHIDDFRLNPEEVIYGPTLLTRRAYGKSLRSFPFTDPVWLEQYLIPQRELRLALEGSSEHTDYAGNARLRKVTDVHNHDLQPLYD